MENRHKIGLATGCLHFSAVLYVIFGVLVFPSFIFEDESSLGLTLAVFWLLGCLAAAAGVEFVVYGLHRRKFWAWVAGLCIFGIYLPSLFLPLGALGLWGLLDNGSQEEFRVGNSRERAKQRAMHPKRRLAAN